MNAKYRVGQPIMLLSRSGEPCKARIVEMWRPGNKKNSHQYRVELWPSDGSVEVQFVETRELTYAIAAAEKASENN